MRKAFDVVWHDGLWLKLWQKGVRGCMWRVIRSMYAVASSRVRAGDAVSAKFPILQGTAQGCTLSPILFDIFIDGLLEEFDAAGLGVVQVGGSASRAPGFAVADDVLGLEGSAERLQQLIQVAFAYCRRWRLAANVSKSAVVVFGPGEVPNYTWRWGETALPVRDRYTYLGVTLHRSCTWSAHVEGVLAKGRKALFTHLPLLRNPLLPTSLKRLVYTTCVRSPLEYAAEVWEPCATDAERLERSVQREAARVMLRCHPKTATAGVLAELGLVPLASRRLAVKARWFGQLHAMAGARYPRMVWQLAQEAATAAAAMGDSAAPLRWQWNARVRAAWQKLRDSEGQPLPSLEVMVLEEGFPCAARSAVECAAAWAMRGQASQRSTLSLYPPCEIELSRVQRYLCHPPSAGSHLKMQFRTGTADVNVFLKRQSKVACAHCPECVGADETCSHFILSCPVYESLRASLFSSIQVAAASAGRSLASFHALDDVSKCQALLSDKYWEDIGVWDAVNELVCDFLSKAWAMRSSYIDLFGDA